MAVLVKVEACAREDHGHMAPGANWQSGAAHSSLGSGIVIDVSAGGLIGRQMDTIAHLFGAAAIAAIGDDKSSSAPGINKIVGFDPGGNGQG